MATLKLLRTLVEKNNPLIHHGGKPMARTKPESCGLVSVPKTLQVVLPPHTPAHEHPHSRGSSNGFTDARGANTQIAKQKSAAIGQKSVKIVRQKSSDLIAGPKENLLERKAKFQERRLERRARRGADVFEMDSGDGENDGLEFDNPVTFEMESNDDGKETLGKRSLGKRKSRKMQKGKKEIEFDQHSSDMEMSDDSWEETFANPVNDDAFEDDEGEDPTIDTGADTDSTEESEDEYFCDVCATESTEQGGIVGRRWALMPEGEYNEQVRRRVTLSTQFL
jgi:hypothetical protein